MVDQNSIFGGMLTTLGAAKKTNCDALGIPWEPSYMLIGDANGTDPVPSSTQTRLINQRYRAQLNQLRVSPTDSNVLIAELVLPPDVGGWWIRELALEDKDGVFSAVANAAPSYKPLLAQGTGRNQVVRMHIITSGTSNIQLKIDPSVVLATREYVDSRIFEELGKLDIKQSVRAATTFNINLVGLQTVDGVALTTGDRVLVKNQTVAKDNGPWVATLGAWVRAKDADNSAKVTPNLTVAVEAGTTQADSIWQLVTDGPINVGTTPLTFRDITDGFARLLSPSFTGTPTAPTPALLDNSKLLATTEFVARAAGNCRGFTSLTASTKLTTAAIGTLVTVIGTFSVTLPASSVMTSGGTVHFHNIGGGVVNVECAGSDTFNVGSGAHPRNITLQPGATLSATCSPGNASWWAAGSAQLQYSKVLGFTAPQFDNSKLLATTEFVQRAAGNYANVLGLTGTTTLTPQAVGCLVSIGGVGAKVTLPDALSVPVGAVVTLMGASTGTLTVQAKAGQSLTTLSTFAGQVQLLASSLGIFRRLNDGTGWILEGGDAALKYSSMFTGLQAGSGYQKLPTGLIIQWGTIATSASAAVAVTMPLAFPTACLRASASMVDITYSTLAAATILSASQLSVSAWAGTAIPLPRITTTASWLAIGH